MYVKLALNCVQDQNGEMGREILGQRYSSFTQSLKFKGGELTIKSSFTGYLADFKGNLMLRVIWT